MGFDYATIRAMPENEGWQYLEVLNELTRPKGKETTHKVLRKKSG